MMLSGFVVLGTLALPLWEARTAQATEPTCADLIAHTRIVASVVNGSRFVFEGSKVKAAYDHDSTGDPLTPGTDYDWQVCGCSQNTTSGFLNLNAQVRNYSGSCDETNAAPQLSWTVQGGTGSGPAHTNTGPGTTSTIHNDPAHGDGFDVGEVINLRLTDCRGNQCAASTFTFTQGCQ